MKMFYLVPILGFITACQPVGITNQGNLSRPIFQASATGPRALEGGLVNQLETGRSSSNVAAGGCSSCQ